MEKYRKNLRIRMLWMSLAIILAVSLLIMNSIKMVEAAEGESFSTGFIDGFQNGLLAAMVGLFSVLIIKYLSIFRDEKKLKLWYNHEHDERRQQIKLKAGGNLVIINSVILLFAGIVGGYFNVVIFYSVIGCAVFQLLVSAVIKLYLLKKY
ncbi:MAG TPA: hypothetical protein P5107_07565 [Thermotogota bacterium]|nr:hypothetical protein [Thermotogota bacterium]HRW34898.1 hypothetical protein [Thermotogota bacterium]